ncbi:hypothetical protein ACMYSQ_003066 [Aspergillus niger]
MLKLLFETFSVCIAAGGQYALVGMQYTTLSLSVTFCGYVLPDAWGVPLVLLPFSPTTIHCASLPSSSFSRTLFRSTQPSFCRLAIAFGQLIPLFIFEVLRKLEQDPAGPASYAHVRALQPPRTRICSAMLITMSIHVVYEPLDINAEYTPE